MVFELSYLGHEEVVVLTEMNDACMVRGNGGHGWPVSVSTVVLRWDNRVKGSFDTRNEQAECARLLPSMSVV
jgi:hypothetical protein